jgi:hypothetical protein
VFQGYGRGKTAGREGQPHPQKIVHQIETGISC